jgi:orotidine-5'-phosphate decarboxylase
METKTCHLVPALDCVRLETALDVVRQTAASPFVVAYKVGFSLGLGYGLPEVVARLRDLTDKPVVYDHQKGGTDIPDTGRLFAATLRRAGIGKAILFPQAGPATLTAWVAALRDEGVEPIVGGIMTHKGYLASEGGYLLDSAALSIYKTAREAGVAAFVVPLTRPDLGRAIAEATDCAGGCDIYSPGLGAQGGDPAAFPLVRNHLLIAGRGLLEAPDRALWVEQLQQRLGCAGLGRV